MKRVVVTGIGVISPIGNGKAEFFASLKAGKNGVAKITHFDASNYPAQIAAEVKYFDPAAYMDKKDARRLVKVIQFAIAASKLALEDAKLVITEHNANRVGVLIGSGIGGIGFLEEQTLVLHSKGPDKCSPFMVPLMINDMSAGMVAIYTGAKGPNLCVTTACASATHSIGDAFKIIQRGDADAMIAGGTEASIVPIGIAGFCAARTLSERNADPEHASRPFDAERDGFVMGEGAGIVILEEYEHAKKRGATIYGEMAGYGMSGDAYHMTAPDETADGPALSMKIALDDAKISPIQINYINAHGTSTKLNDKVETLAIKKVFGEDARKLAISSTKSMLGHLLGAAGGVEFIAMLMAVQEDVIHPTINYETPDPECDLDYVPNQARKKTVNYAMSNSFGFGGHNAILILKKFLP